jgi:translocator protein
MATAQEGLTQRVVASASRDDGAGESAAAVSGPNKKPGGGRANSSRRGLRSLAAAVSFSVALTALSFFAAGQSPPSPKTATASTVAVVRAGSVASEAMLALAAWMAWAEGGLHARPAATLLPYAAHLGAALAWAPLVLCSHAAARAGLACCAVMAAGAVACARGFGAVNPVAGDLAKPAVAWAVILAVVNYKML